MIFKKKEFEELRLFLHFKYQHLKLYCKFCILYKMGILLYFLIYIKVAPDFKFEKRI